MSHRSRALGAGPPHDGSTRALKPAGLPCLGRDPAPPSAPWPRSLGSVAETSPVLSGSSPHPRCPCPPSPGPHGPTGTRWAAQSQGGCPPRWAEGGTGTGGLWSLAQAPTAPPWLVWPPLPSSGWGPAAWPSGPRRRGSWKRDVPWRVRGTGCPGGTGGSACWAAGKQPRRRAPLEGQVRPDGVRDDLLNGLLPTRLSLSSWPLGKHTRHRFVPLPLYLCSPPPVPLPPLLPREHVHTTWDPLPRPEPSMALARAAPSPGSRQLGPRACRGSEGRSWGGQMGAAAGPSPRPGRGHSHPQRGSQPGAILPQGTSGHDTLWVVPTRCSWDVLSGV